MQAVCGGANRKISCQETITRYVCWLPKFHSMLFTEIVDDTVDMFPQLMLHNRAASKFLPLLRYQERDKPIFLLLLLSHCPARRRQIRGHVQKSPPIAIFLESKFGARLLACISVFVPFCLNSYDTV